MSDTLPPGYHLERGHLKVRFVYNRGTNGKWCFSDSEAIRAAWSHHNDPARKAQTRVKGTARQAARAEREAALGRVRRGYYATPSEHASIAEHITLLRSSTRLGDITVTDAADVLPEFRHDN